MSQKYRMLEVGEMLQEGDEWVAFGVWKSVRNFYPVDESECYRRPLATEQQYRNLTFDDTIQPGDEVWEFGNGPWEPVSVSEHGQQYRMGYWRMRRPVTTTEETIDDVRAAWQKDHMEMKRRADEIEKMWFDQRKELADAKNKITDLTRCLEYALSDKVIAEARIREIQKILA